MAIKKSLVGVTLASIVWGTASEATSREFPFRVKCSRDRDLHSLGCES